MHNETLSSRLDQARKKLLVDAAEIVFLRGGVESSSMSDIAKEAGCSKRTVYHHFGSKDDLIAEVMLRGFTLLLEKLEQSERTNKATSPLMRLQRAARVLFGFHNDYPEYFRTIVEYQPQEEAGQSPDSILGRMYVLGERANDVLVSIITDGQQQGVFRRDLDPDTAAATLWVTVQGALWVGMRKTHYLQSSHNLDQKTLFNTLLDFLTESPLCLHTEN